MGEQGKISAAQVMRMAKQLKSIRSTGEEAAQLEQLARQGISEDQQAQLHELMRDKAKMQALLASPQAQALLRKLGGEQAE